MAWLVRIGLLVLLALPSPLLAEVGPKALAALTELAPLRGEAVRRRDIEGRIVVVTFFASWCPPCHEEFRHLKRLVERRGAELAVIAVDVFENRDKAQTRARLKRFLDQHQPPFAVLAGGAGIRRLYDDLDRIPSLFVFDSGGNLAWHFRHARGAERTHVTEDELEAVLARLR